MRGTSIYSWRTGYARSAPTRPNTVALRQGSTRVVGAGGEASRGQPAYEASAVLADRLGTTVVHFPGDHGGFGSLPAAFAEMLHKVLRDG